jgi:hypothetical protein
MDPTSFLKKAQREKSIMSRFKRNTYQLTESDLRLIIREALIAEKVGGEKIKGWKPPWEGGGGGGGSGGGGGGYGYMDMEDLTYGMGGYEREISGEEGADDSYDDGDDDGDDGDGDD